MIKAAGILFQTVGGRVLLVRRSSVGDAAGQWSTPGGKLEDGETCVQAATRECVEELGDLCLESIGGENSNGPMILLTRSQSFGVDYTTFLQKVKKTFSPKLNDEHTGFAWENVKKLNLP